MTWLKEEWKPYGITLIIVSLGALLVHVKFNTPPNLNLFIMWLPALWLLVFCLALMFKFLFFWK